jgi:biopolymer transport protein ExbD
MKHALLVCFAATILMGAVVHLGMIRQSAAQAHTLQRGVSVEMATASNAQAWPRADDNDAWVVTVDNTGQIYFGIDPMTTEELKQWMIQHPRKRDQKLYIKADARAPFGNVEKALDAAGAAEFAEPVLLVNQPDASVKPGTVVSPKGLEVAIDGVSIDRLNKDAQAIVIEVTGSANEAAVTINREPIPWDSLRDRLRESVAGRSEKSVAVQADGQTSFAQVARVIDACKGAKATVVLSGTTL